MTCSSILCRQVAGRLMVAVQCDLRHGPADAADAVYTGRQAGAAGQVYRTAAPASDPGLPAAGLSRRTVAHRPLVSGQYPVSRSISIPGVGRHGSLRAALSSGALPSKVKKHKCN